MEVVLYFDEKVYPRIVHRLNVLYWKRQLFVSQPHFDDILSSEFTEALVSIKLVTFVLSMNTQRENLLSTKPLTCR